MKLSQLTQARPIETTVDVIGEKVNVTYDRARLGREFWKLTTWREQLAYVLVGWDVTDDTTGKPYAPSENANGSRPKEWLHLFEPLPDDALLPIYRHILDDSRMGKTQGGD